MHAQEHSIAVRGNSRTTFLFPAELRESLAYFMDYRKILLNLPHISMSESYPGNRFRLVYKTVELGLYRVEITCDVRVYTEKHPTGERLVFESINNHKPVKSSVGLHSLSGQGNYQSESIFEARGQETVVHFSLQLFADLPCPWGLLIVPPLARNSNCSKHHKFPDL